MFKTRQQEKFIVLMENYGEAMNYADSATTSSGTAMEKYSAYTDSLEGRLNSLTASFEEFSSTILDSDLVAFFINIAQVVVNALSAISGFGDGIVPILLVVSTATIATFALIGAAAIKLKTHLGVLKTSFINALKSPLTYMTILTSLFFAFRDDIGIAGEAIAGVLAAAAIAFVGFGMAGKISAKMIKTAFESIPIIGQILLIIELATIALTALISLIKAWINKEAEQRKAALETAKAYQEQADALREVANAADEAADSVKTLVAELEELQNSGELDVSDWMESIEAIGDEVSKLYPDEHLTSLQAINRLLEEEYTYNDLINMTMQERIDLLAGIENGTRELSVEAARDAYTSQKQASDKLRYALTKYGYDLKSNDETFTWGKLSGSQIKAAIKEAEEISAGLSGVHMSRNSGKDIDIKVDGATISEYVDNLRAAVDEYEERYKYNFGALSENAVYNYLSDSLAQAEASLSAQQSTLESLAEQTAELYGTGLVIDFDEESTKAEAKSAYNIAVSELIDDISNDSSISEALNEGLLNDDAIKEYAQEYMRKYHTELFNAANDMPIVVPLKSAIDIFDEFEGEFNLLKDAIDEFNESGSVSTDTIRSMTDEFPELLKYIKQTSNGFEMMGESMDAIMADYWTSKIDPVVKNINATYENYKAVEAAYDGSLESYKIVNEAYQQMLNAIESGTNTITAYNAANDTWLEEQYTEILESQKDALEEQADAYEELCDIRKELLKTYEDEQKYAKELEKKQKAVNKLSTQLSIARLDTSASGQARVRELEAELEEAQEELDDFTLEHAIDVVTKQIDDSNDQYKRLINDGVSRLEAAINGVGFMAAEAIKGSITAAEKTPIASGGNNSVTENITGAITDVTTGITGDSSGITKMPENAPIDAPTNAEDDDKNDGGNPVKPPPKTKLEEGDDYTVSGLGNNWFLTGKDDITVSIGGVPYDVKVSNDAITSGAVYDALNAMYGGSIPDNGMVAVYGGSAYITTKGSWRRLVEEEVNQLIGAYNHGLNNYHTGGFVGDDITLDSNEEFAKLLKGEFVSTPAQMHRFMKKTLPEVATAGGTTNEFNAPLIVIECDNVTSEAMPVLKNVVDEAVKEVKKQLDSGMSRVGRKKTAKKLLI